MKSDSLVNEVRLTGVGAWETHLVVAFPGSLSAEFPSSGGVPRRIAG